MERAFYRDLPAGGARQRLAERVSPGGARQEPWRDGAAEAQTDRSLLSLLERMEDLAPLQAPVGLGRDGRPLLIDFSRPASWHLIVAGPRGSGKSSLLRTLMFALALGARRSEVRFVGIDRQAQDLLPMEALPHALADLAVDTQDAWGVLKWAAEEVARRVEAGFLCPHVFIFVEALDRLLEGLPARAGLPIDRILSHGTASGFHLIASLGAAGWDPAANREGVVYAEVERRGGIGAFRLSNGRANSVLWAAHLSAREIDRAVRLAAAGWRVAHPMPGESPSRHEMG